MGRGAWEKGIAMILEIIKILVALPASMVALATLVGMARPGKGKHRRK